jgi:hypothetical protein
MKKLPLRDKRIYQIILIDYIYLKTALKTALKIA